MPFAGNPRQPMPPGIAFNLLDYIELVDWTGRQIREDKRGSIDTNTPPLLQRLNISPQHWLELSTNFEDRFKGLVGSRHSLKKLNRGVLEVLCQSFIIYKTGLIHVREIQL